MKTKNSSFLKITVMLSVLADGRKLTTLVMLTRKESSRRKTTLWNYIYLNVMRSVG